MSAVFEQVFILFVFAVIGYVLSKTKVVKNEHSKILSKLLVYVFLPSNIFKTFAANCNPEYFSKNYVLIITSAVIIVTLVITAYLASKLFSKDKYERSVYEYSMVIPNYGYMGYALAESLTGEAGLLNIMMFALPVACYTYTRGFCILTKRNMSFKKMANPILISMFAGVVAGLVKIPIAGTVSAVLNKASACMAPVSMLLAGIVISEFKIKELLTSYKSYIIVALRLFIIPVCIGMITLNICGKEVSQTAVLLYAMPCGLNTIVFPKTVDGNCKIGASLAFISNILACLSIPVVCYIFGI